MIEAVSWVRAATTALFHAGMVAFALSASLDIAVHLGLWNVPERPAHLAIVGSMAVIALALVLRGSLVTHQRGVRHADR
ncbi:MAG TPA: hypothetical protein VI814_09260 [Candidatus Limnocylindria bacterium]